MSINDLRGYLCDVRILEEACYTYRTSMNYLKNRADQLGRKEVIKKPEKEWGGFTLSYDWEVSQVYSFAEVLGLIVMIIYCWHEREFWQGSLFGLFSAGILAVVGSIALAGIIGTLIYAGNLIYSIYFWRKCYKDKCDEYQKKTEQDDIRVKRELQVQRNLMLQYGELDKAYNQTKQLRDRLYSYNIIYPKYRDMVAVTMFCEYLDSGRCTRLEGADGAYNKFDQQVAAGLIIAELRNISSQLEAIRQTQYMLYEEVSRGNSTAERILKSAIGMESNSEVVRYNSEVAAQNARIAAEEIAMQNIWIGFR